MELNKFADWTDEEYNAMLGFRPNLDKEVNEFLEVGDLPATINWVEKGVVSHVKDQGKCGSCWSFSTTGAMESAFQLKDGQTRLLSEQQLVDCSISFGNNGCGGGLVEYAFNYATKHALATEDAYPYTASDQKCKDVQGVAQLSSFKEV
jgi:cathepsin L